MSSSDFKIERDSTISHLISELIQHLCQIDPGTTNFSLAEEFVYSNFEHHQFLSPNSNQVERSINNLSEKFLLNNKSKEGEELRFLFDMFKAKKLNNTIESIHHSIMLVLLCIGESPARGSYRLPDNLNFNERAEKQRLQEEASLRQMESEIREELAANEDLKQIRQDWQQELLESSGEDEFSEDMQVDKPLPAIKIVEQEQGEQTDWEPRAQLFGGLRIHQLDWKHPEAETKEIEKEVEMDDEQALVRLLGIRSFKQIMNEINSRKSRDEIEEIAAKRILETEKCLKEPMALSSFYRGMYAKELKGDWIDMRRVDKNFEKSFAPVPKWPYKMLTERVILNDVFYMLKGLSNDTFIIQGQKIALKEKIEVAHLTPLALHNCLCSFMRQAETLLKIQNKLDTTIK